MLFVLNSLVRCWWIVLSLFLVKWLSVMFGWFDMIVSGMLVVLRVCSVCVVFGVRCMCVGLMLYGMFFSSVLFLLSSIVLGSCCLCFRVMMFFLLVVLLVLVLWCLVVVLV